jgi:hypothetical protein
MEGGCPIVEKPVAIEPISAGISLKARLAHPVKIRQKDPKGGAIVECKFVVGEAGDQMNLPGESAQKAFEK